MMQISINSKYILKDSGETVIPLLIQDGIVYCKVNNKQSLYLGIKEFIEKTQLLEKIFPTLKFSVKEKKETTKFKTKPNKKETKENTTFISINKGQTILDKIENNNAKEQIKDNKKTNKQPIIEDYIEDGF